MANELTTAWNLKELRALVREKHGDAQVAALEPHLASVDWKIRIAAYHVYTFNEAFAPFFAAPIDGRIAAVKMILSNGEEALQAREAKLAGEANVIACAQSTHSASDILGYVITHSLNLKLEDGKKHELPLAVVNKRLSGEFKDKVTRLLGLQEFRYLQDFVNTTKHVSLVFSNYTVKLEPDAEVDHGLKFKSFRCRSRTHPEKWARQFICELQAVAREYVQIGRALNDALR
jgi:hypothetical protein